MMHVRFASNVVFCSTCVDKLYQLYVRTHVCECRLAGVVGLWCCLNAAMLGTGFFIVESDVSGNVNRLKTRMEEQPERYRHDVFQILLDEKEQCKCMDSDSCTNGLLWLTRYV